MSTDIIECVAWDLLGTHSESFETTHLARIKGGRTFYEAAYTVDSDSETKVRLARLEVKGGLHQVNRYVLWDTPMELVPFFQARGEQ